MPALWFKNILQIKFNNTLESNASNQNLGRPGQQDKSLMLKLFYRKYFSLHWSKVHITDHTLLILPASILWAWPGSVGIVVLDCVDTGGLLLGLQLHLGGPGEVAGHGRAEEYVDAEHDEEEDAEHDTEPEQPGGAQVAVPGVGWNIAISV